MRFSPETYFPASVVGRSETAVIVEEKLNNIIKYRNLSITQATREAKLNRVLNYLLSEQFSKSDWDCYGAQAAKKLSISYAFIILQSLPKHYPLPNVVVEPTGDIGMDWVSKEGELAASVDEKGALSFACLSKTNEETFGSGKLDNKILPKNFLEILSSIY